MREINLKQRLFHKEPALGQTYEIVFTASSDVPDEVIVHGHVHTMSRTTTHEVKLPTADAKTLYRNFLNSGYRTHMFTTMMPEWVQQVR